jgi:hypothetical protein
VQVNTTKTTRYQFWQQNNQPIELGTDEKVYKILDYIHENPVKAGPDSDLIAIGICSPEDYLYSSAVNYANLPEKLIDVILI